MKFKVLRYLPIFKNFELPSVKLKFPVCHFKPKFQENLFNLSKTLILIIFYIFKVTNEGFTKATQLM